MIHSLEKNTQYTYIYRVYAEPGTLRYKFAMPVSYRRNGEWEAHAWNSLIRLWPDAPRQQLPSIMVWLYHELKRVEPLFKKLTGTFENDRLSAYKRGFRAYLDLIPLRKIEKHFNGCILQATVVEMRPIKGK